MYIVEICFVMTRGARAPTAACVHLAHWCVKSGTAGMKMDIHGNVQHVRCTSGLQRTRHLHDRSRNALAAKGSRRIRHPTLDDIRERTVGKILFDEIILYFVRDRRKDY